MTGKGSKKLYLRESHFQPTRLASLLESPRAMALVTTLVLQTLIHNIVIKAVHIPGKLNSIADSLSRSDFQKFRQLCPGAEDEKTPIPNHLWTS
jgi:hypothetical protein